MSIIHWLGWTTEAFAAAAREQKPVLLTLVTRWSESCRALDRHGFEDPVVARIVQERFIPVRVDAERRPDIAERYGLGGWPTTVFLTQDGWILGGGTLAAPQLADVLSRVANTYAQQIGSSLATHSSVGSGLPTAGDGTTVVEWCRHQLLCAFDQEHGGFGTAPKFPHVAPLFFGLHLLERGTDAELHHAVTRTLDEMGWGPLYDDVEGGFFRAAASRNWSHPEPVKLLDVNADLIRLYLRAAHVLGQVRYRDRAADVLAFIERALFDRADGGFYASQWRRERDADESAERVDRTFFIDANARMIRAWLAAAQPLESPTLAERAIQSLERLVPVAYRRGAGVAHYVDTTPSVRGLLGDQVHLSATLLDAGDACGDRVYSELAEELMRSTLRRFWDADGHGFVDRVKTLAGAGDVGLLGESWKPVTLNSEAVRVLVTLAERTEDDIFATHARETLSWLSRVYRQDWVSATEYAVVVAAMSQGASA